jgi:MoxR-like ATPase
LADEINRASPKTQSALLETMQENSVTLLGTTRLLPQPFFVLASQNPIELEGTYPLPEAQLDRFLFRLLFDQVDVEVLDRIITERRRGELPAADWQMEPAELEQLYRVMDRIYLPRPVARYIARLVSATHPGAAEATEVVNRYVSYGASPRAAIAIAEAARGHALVDGRPSAGFEDVQAVAQPVLNHRLILNYQARFDRMSPSQLLGTLIDQLDETGLKLPGDVQWESRDRRHDRPTATAPGGPALVLAALARCCWHGPLWPRGPSLSGTSTFPLCLRMMATPTTATVNSGPAREPFGE